MGKKYTKPYGRLKVSTIIKIAVVIVLLSIGIPLVKDIVYNFFILDVPPIQSNNKLPTNDPILLIKQKELIALDPVISKEVIFSTIPKGRFLSAKWSPDRTRLAYLRAAKSSCFNKIFYRECTYGAYELGIISKGKKEATIIYTLPTGANSNQVLDHPKITYNWLDASKLIYAVSNSERYNKNNKEYFSAQPKSFTYNDYDFDKKFFQYDILNGHSSLVKTIHYENAEPWEHEKVVQFQIRGKTIFYTHEVKPPSINSFVPSIRKFSLDNPSVVEVVTGTEWHSGIGDFVISPDGSYSVFFAFDKENSKKLFKLDQNSIKILADESIRGSSGTSSYENYADTTEIKMAPKDNYMAIMGKDSEKVTDYEYIDIGKFTIIDSDGTKISEIDSHTLGKLIPNMSSYRDVHFSGLSFSPDGRKIFLTAYFFKGYENMIPLLPFALLEELFVFSTQSPISAQYAFVMDVDGNNLKKVTISNEGWKAKDIRGTDDWIIGVAW